MRVHKHKYTLYILLPYIVSVVKEGWTHRRTRRRTCCWTCRTWWPPGPTTWWGTWSTGSWCTGRPARTYTARRHRYPDLRGYSGVVNIVDIPEVQGGAHLAMPKSDIFTSLFLDTRQFLAACRRTRNSILTRVGYFIFFKELFFPPLTEIQENFKSNWGALF